jgi:hypothetical protein
MWHDVMEEQCWCATWGYHALTEYMQPLYVEGLVAVEVTMGNYTRQLLVLVGGGIELFVERIGEDRMAVWDIPGNRYIEASERVCGMDLEDS